MAMLATFGRRMGRLSERVESNALFIKKKVARNVHTVVVRTTPIDSGRARFSWNVNMNRPNYTYDYASFEGGARRGDWVGKMAASSIAIQAATQKDSVYISNGLPYIGKLNRGYSSQAPRDYVRTAAIIGARIVRDSRILR